MLQTSPASCVHTKAPVCGWLKLTGLGPPGNICVKALQSSTFEEGSMRLPPLLTMQTGLEVQLSQITAESAYFMYNYLKDALLRQRCMLL